MPEPVSTTDRRTAILARCDELERIARAATAREGCESWLAAYRPNEAAWAWDVVTSPNKAGSGIVDGRTKETALHVATWDPAAVFDLVAGVRTIVAPHRPEMPELSSARGRSCEGCGGLDANARPVEDCPTLVATARMLGLAAQ